MKEDNITPAHVGLVDPTSISTEPTHQIRSLLKSSASQSSLQSSSTTAVSSVNIQTLAFPDGPRGTFSTATTYQSSATPDGSDVHNASRLTNQNGSEIDDRVSVFSCKKILKANRDLESLLDEELQIQSQEWRFIDLQNDDAYPFENTQPINTSLHNFEKEFDEIYPVDTMTENYDEVLAKWKTKYKHYLILSSAGKPIYSRHGDQNLINSYIGVIQTIISFFQDSNDSLLGFTAQGTRFVISTYGPLYLVAISRLGESDSQLKAQLEALYMQILSTLTLPTLTQLFTNRPNTDLRRPLEGTETLLSSLADSFTKGSPSTLLSALECLVLQSSQRNDINNSLLKARSSKLLYGLVVAGSRLVSVVRPKRHSLHPSDLRLIFNMLFEADCVRAEGGENWIPVCLPGFNNRGYLYMYVSFLNTYNPEEIILKNTSRIRNRTRKEIAILLISTDKDSFFDLKKMRDDTVTELENNGSLEIIKNAIREGRPSISDILPGVQLRHFLYKSRTNVQFVMPELSPDLSGLIPRRRLMTLYHNLHASTHNKYSHLKILQCVSREGTSLAWSTPVFEFYCVAGPNLSRAALTQGANQIIEWVKREEERLFIIGGAVF